MFLMFPFFYAIILLLGGSLVLKKEDRFIGPGHAAIFQENGRWAWIIMINDHWSWSLVMIINNCEHHPHCRHFHHNRLLWPSPRRITIITTISSNISHNQLIHLSEWFSFHFYDGEREDGIPWIEVSLFCHCLICFQQYRSKHRKGHFRPPLNDRKVSVTCLFIPSWTESWPDNPILSPAGLWLALA